jgi:tRNA(His) guanylyltransferase
MDRDDIGFRMKRNYESVTQSHLPRRTYAIIRLDGKAFHQYTRGCERPFDARLMQRMDHTAIRLCEEIHHGTRFAYTQSDEISLLLTDFDTVHTAPWLGGNVQKIVSISASMATAFFNAAPGERHTDEPAVFDSRVFTIPDPTEVFNYFVWRQQDASRNSILMAAQSKFPHSQLHGKGYNELQEMLWQEHGINWNDYPEGFKRGRFIEPKKITKTVTYIHKKTGEPGTDEAVRNVWGTVPVPVFTREPDWLQSRIPRYD